MLWSQRRAHRKHSKNKRSAAVVVRRDDEGKKNNNIVSLNKQLANCLKISSNKTQYASRMLLLLLRESLSLSVARLTVGNAHAHHKPPGDCQDRVGVYRKGRKRKEKERKRGKKEKENADNKNGYVTAITSRRG